MKTKNKLLSILLVVFMAVSAMPGVTFAQEEPTSELQNLYYRLNVEKEAKIGYLRPLPMLPPE